MHAASLARRSQALLRGGRRGRAVGGLRARLVLRPHVLRPAGGAFRRAPEQQYSIAGFADDVAWLCGQLGAGRPAVVGHSMGGLVALQMAALHSEAVAAIALLDSPVMPRVEIAGLMVQIAAALRGPGYRQAAQALVAHSMFLPDSDAALKARIVEAMASAPQHVLASCWEAIGAFDGAAAAAACEVPALFIDAGGIGDTARFKSLCAQLVVEKTAGSGHFHQLEVPDQVNAMLQRFLVSTA
jgi:pimeloyl-ACP methyl ester carboxylesterase